MRRRSRRGLTEVVERLESRALLAAATGSPPVISKAGNVSQTYVEDTAPVFVLTASTTLTDRDSKTLSGGSLTAAIVSNGVATDTLSIVNQTSTGSGVTVANSIVSVGGKRVGTLSGGTGTTPLAVKFDTEAATPAAAQAILRQLAFSTSGDNPSTLARSVQVAVSDGNGNTSRALKRTVNVTAVNDAPRLRKIGNQILATVEGNTFGSDMYLAPSDVFGSPISLSIPLSAVDPEGSAVQLSYRIVQGPAILPLTLALNAGVLAINGVKNASGSVLVEVTASDGKLSESSQFRVDCNETTINNVRVSGPVLRIWLERGGTSGLGKPMGEMTRDDDGTLNQTFEFGSISVPLEGAPEIQAPPPGGSVTPNDGRTTFARRPTLVVLVQGAHPGKYAEYPWMTALAENLIKDLRTEGSQPYVMMVQWDTYAANTRSVPFAARAVNRWLEERQQKWDVVLVGHSRGGIFTSELTRQISSRNVATLHNVMLDPTASVGQADSYPTNVASNVTRSVVYDDGYPFAAPFMVRDGLAVAGAEYRRLSVPGLSFMDTYNSHTGLANHYAATVYKRDLTKLLNGNAVDTNRPYKREAVGEEVRDENGTVIGFVPCETIICPNQSRNEGAAIVIDGSIREGTAFGKVTILGVGGIDVMIGKAGVNANVGTVGFGKAGVSITDKGATISVTDSTGLVSGGMVVGRDQTRLDVSISGIQISIGGPGAGVYAGGNKISIDRDMSLPAGTVKWDQKLPNGSTTSETLRDGKKIASERRDALGNYVIKRFPTSGTVIERGTALGRTFLERRDAAGAILSQSALNAGKWTKDTFLDGKIVKTDLFAGAFGSPLEQTKTWTVSGAVTGIKDFAASGVMLREQLLDGTGKWMKREFSDLGVKLREVNFFGDNDYSGAFKIAVWNPSGQLTAAVENTLVGDTVKRIAQQFSIDGRWVEHRLDAPTGKIVDQITRFGGPASQIFKKASWNLNGDNTFLEEFTPSGVKTWSCYLDSAGRWFQTEFVDGKAFLDVFDGAGKLIPNLSNGANRAGGVISDTWKKWTGGW
jgi:hypothetical protein